MVSVLGLSLIMVFLVLALQFDSFRDPLIILLGSAPLALFAAMVINFTGFTTINIYSQVGLITLVGLISKNAILIAIANQAQAEGKNKLEAIKADPSIDCAGPDDHGRHGVRALPLGIGEGWCRSAYSIGFILVIGMLIGRCSHWCCFQPSMH